MALISIDLNRAYTTANALKQADSRLDSERGGLHDQWQHLSANWEGHDKYYVENDVRQVLARMESLSNQGRLLGDKLEALARRFEEADKHVAYEVPPLIWSFSSEETTSFNWWKWGVDETKNGLDLLETVLKFGQGLKYKDYKSFGRGINWLLDSPRAGWVGRMDDLGHLIKESPVVGGAVKVLPWAVYALGAASDILGGEAAPKAFVSEAVDFVLQKGIEKGIEYLIPGAGQALLVYDAALLIGRLAAGGADLVGAHDTAVWINNALDVVDIGTYTKKAGDAIYDFGEYYVTRPDKIIPDLKSTADKVTEFGVGLEKGAADLVGNAAGAAEEWFQDLFH